MTRIGSHSEISSDAKVPSHNIVIGGNVIIEDRVTLVAHVEIGDNSIIHSGTVMHLLIIYLWKRRRD